ncbi:hypothetical protein [Mycobacterium sp.]|uniref:hypothetical protein n=1 Tax=Mycobacterium sp. TaxID=1785 RepID=UPI002CEE8670|nr:hypothetical protein [Mycobacterium sp.]HME49029.1 hypothetical protein [Mycobacterium sp.]
MDYLYFGNPLIEIGPLGVLVLLVTLTMRTIILRERAMARKSKRELVEKRKLAQAALLSGDFAKNRTLTTAA